MVQFAPKFLPIPWQIAIRIEIETAIIVQAP